jgi:hypothetical protein
MSATDDAPVESCVDLPAEVDYDFDVYINGILQEYEIDYRLDRRTLVFSRPLIPERRMTALQWIRVVLGIAGTYTRHDSIDIAYEHDGRRLVITGLRPRTSR